MSPDKLLAYHRSMLLDAARTGAFRRAVEAAVRPGDLVLDLGTGTGLLALCALRAGARHVHAVEENASIEIARAVVAANGASDRVSFHRDESFRVSLPERVDVVVSETVGNFGLDEGILETLIDARERFLAPGGRVVPAALELYAAPVADRGLAERTLAWAGTIEGLDFSPVRRFAAASLHRARLDPASLLAEPASLGRIDSARVASPEFAGAGETVATRAGEAVALGGWFACEVAPGERLSSAPPAIAPSWNHAVLPLEPPLALAAGEALRIEVDAGRRGSRWRWRVARSGREPAERAHDTDASGLAAPGPAPAGGAGAAPPHLNDRGRLVRHALALMDGERPLAAIAEEIVARWPDQFPSREGLREYLERLAEKFGR